MCFQIDEFLLFFMAVFLTSWFPLCAQCTCAAVRITWPEFAKKTSSHFSSQSFYLICRDILFCTFLSTYVIAVQCPNLHFLLSPQLLITTSPHHNTEQYGAAQFNKSLKNIADHLQFVQGNDISKAVRNMAPIKIDIPSSPQGKLSGAHQTSSILCQVIVTDRK
jgi:hypothetical protein